ncbi:MAG: HEAT repeat domain-containing protein [Spirochaetes bacterium]|nr:HEAT repeat domain-containing protein [Spirochaetota bacterium]MBN2771312.1 HEAT repeat domain-containing protein [Spirochaetota bacterium]
MEKDFLQSIKLEISRNFSLTAYERIAFHKILNIYKSDNGAEILLRDIGKPGAIRLSALEVITGFNYKDAFPVIKEILNTSEKKEELCLVFDFIENNGTAYFLSDLENFAKKRGANTFPAEINRAVFLTGLLVKRIDPEEDFNGADYELPDKDEEDQPIVVKGKELVSRYTEMLISIAQNGENPVRLRATAITALDHYTELPFYQKMLEEDNDTISFAVFQTVAQFAHREMKIYQDLNQKDVFTHVPPKEDNFMLNVRVLLSTFSNRFDSFSNETKVAFIKVLLACNHREYLVYIMKTLTSGDNNLIDMTLYTILAAIDYLNNPDKLFRNLIAIPSLTDRDNQIIVETFVKYFSKSQRNQSSNLIRDKLYNYIIVMLDNFFKSYCDNYIVPEIKEKDYIDEFQAIRKFVLEKCDPFLKRRIIKFLTTEDIDLKTLLIEIAERITFVNESEEKALALLLEVLHEPDAKAREISAQRLNDIDFEKKYLKLRLIRLCHIIGELRIKDASNSLGKMFDYIKKFYDEELFCAITYSLSQLSYPYMLGELEYLFLNSDSDDEALKMLHYLSQFSEQRATIIMLDFLKSRFGDVSPIILRVLQVIAKKDIKSDKSVNEFSKIIVDKNRNSEIRAAAVHLIGKTGFERDVLYLHELFMEENDNIVKEAVVQALDFIGIINPTIRKKEIAPFLKGYLKDSSIKVRIYSCIILLQSGDLGALSLLKDMMIIRNKDIQREILLVLGSYMTIELAFFLLSLFNSDYGITRDIVPLFNYLSPEDKKEIDHFIVNIFKKHEGTRVDFAEKSILESNQKYNEQLSTFVNDTRPIMYVVIKDYHTILTRYRSTELSMLVKNSLMRLVDVIKANDGVVVQVTNGCIDSYFKTLPDSAMAALEVQELEKDINFTVPEDEHLEFFIYTEYAEVCLTGNELLLNSVSNLKTALSSGLKNRVFLNRKTADGINMAFKCETYPETPFDPRGREFGFRELLNALNFNALVDEMLARIRREMNDRIQRKKEVDRTSVKHKVYLSKEAQQISDSINELGKVLKKDLSDILQYVKKRSTDRELIKQVDGMLADAYKRFTIEKNKINLE